MNHEITHNITHNILETGQRAFAAFKKAVETGESTDFVEMMAEDVRFTAPFPFEEWRGEQRGADRVREMIVFERDVMQNRVTLSQTSITANGETVGVEFSVAGTNKGGEYHNYNAVFFEFQDNRIRAFREYCGDVDPKAVAAVTGEQ